MLRSSLKVARPAADSNEPFLLPRFWQRPSAESTNIQIMSPNLPGPLREPLLKESFQPKRGKPGAAQCWVETQWTIEFNARATMGSWDAGMEGFIPFCYIFGWRFAPWFAPARQHCNMQLPPGHRATKHTTRSVSFISRVPTCKHKLFFRIRYKFGYASHHSMHPNYVTSTVCIPIREPWGVVIACSSLYVPATFIASSCC